MEDLNKKAVEAIHEYYNCCGKYRCTEYDYCQFGNGCNTAYDCNECGADDFYAGFMYSLNKESCTAQEK